MAARAKVVVVCSTTRGQSSGAGDRPTNDAIDKLVLNAGVASGEIMRPLLCVPWPCAAPRANSQDFIILHGRRTFGAATGCLARFLFWPNSVLWLPLNTVAAGVGQELRRLQIFYNWHFGRPLKAGQAALIGFHA